MQTYIEDQPTISRWMAAIPLALIITMGLLAVMEQLVLSDLEAPEDVTEVPMLDVVYKHVDIDTFKPIKRVEKQTIENPPKVPDLSPPDPAGGELTIAGTFTPPSLGNGGVSINFNGMPVAQYLTTPKYPNRAVQRGIEGYVDVYFDISVIGVTENISVTGAKPEGIFEKSALAAVKRWRYQPKMVDGNAHAYQGMTQRIVFEMED